MVRREDEFTDACQGNTAGLPIPRNPGVAMLWPTMSYKPFDDGQGRTLLEMGSPVARIEWYAEGRPATREEVLWSVTTGLPHLHDACELESTPDRRLLAHAELEKAVPRFQPLLPA